MILLDLLLGLVLLVAGGEALVRGAVALARRFGVSPLLIGLTLVGFGTSTPELVTSVQAALQGSPGIAVGNVIGSNIANILLILGLAAVVRPLLAARAAFLRDGVVLVVAALAAVAVVLAGELGRAAGVVLVALLIAYVVFTYLRERRTQDAGARMHEREAAAITAAPAAPWLAGLLALAGLGLTLAGAQFLVGAAIELAAAAGISDRVIGLTVVAVGTSLPELVTSLTAARRGQSDVAFGNIVGSNIYNVLGILGVTAIAQPIAVPAGMAALDIWVMLAATLGLVLFTVTGWRLSRLEGAAFLAGYGVYLAVLVAGA